MTRCVHLDNPDTCTACAALDIEQPTALGMVQLIEDVDAAEALLGNVAEIDGDLYLKSDDETYQITE